jgi:LacI family transcriptional regulator
MKKEATIYDIAKELGISPATVSRALSGHPATNSKTKEKVNKLASQLGYQSNRFASSLRKQKSNNIGVIVHRLNSFVTSSILAGMESVVNKNGYNLIISQSLESKDKEIENAKTFFNSRVDALMISFSFDTDNLDHILPFIEKKIPVVFFDRIMDHPSCTSIVIDNYKDGYNVTKHLIDQGCKRLLHVTGSLQRNVYADRLSGFEFALRESKLTYNTDSLLVTRFDDETPKMVLDKIKRMDQTPDGIFFANDYSAAATIILLKKNGYRIPEDIAIVGFNDEPIAKIVEPNLSSVQYPAKEMGEVAAQTVINYLKGSSSLSQGSSIILRSETFFRPSSLRIKEQHN